MRRSGRARLTTMAKRLLAIAAFFVVAGTLVTVFGEVVRLPESESEAVHVVADRSDNRSEQGMYDEYALAMTQAPRNPKAKERDLKTFYARRAYPGAPPAIPHEEGDSQKMEDRCSSCHELGGYVPKYNTYAPLTPHPEYGNCRQCHVSQATSGTFVAIGWRPLMPPPTAQKAQPSGPNVMPHGLQMRERCQSCHVGPGAIAALRTAHPERTNCLQCHVPQTTTQVFVSGADQ